MSEAGDTPAVEEPQQGQEPAKEQAKEKRVPIKRTQKPNSADLKAKIDALESQIAVHKARIDTIRSDLESRNKRRNNDTESQGVRNQLQELRSQFQQVLAQKQSVRSELDSATKARDALRMQVRGMKGKMEYTTVERIDEQTARLEARLQHTSMPLAEEKKVLDDIKKLKASRASVAQYNDKLERLNGDDDVRGIMDRLKGMDEQLNGIKNQEEGLRKQLSDIRAKDDARNNDVPKLLQERDDAREVVRIAVETIKKLRAEHRAKHDEWWAGEQAWREQRVREKAKRDEEYAAIRAERDAERKARQAELAGEPFNKEVTLCEQVQAYLGRFLEEGKATAAVQEKQDVAPLEGMKLFAKKRVEDDNPYASLEKKSKKGRKADKAAKAAPVDKSLNHSLDLLSAFSKLKVEAPLTVSKVPGAIDSVKERLAHYLKKQEEAKQNGTANMEESADSGAATDKADAAAAKLAAPAEYVAGGDAPTPAEAAGGRITSAALPAADADAADAADVVAANGTAAGDVAVGLSHGADGTVSVQLTVGGAGGR